MGGLEKRISDLILNYLPAAPASIVAVGLGRADVCSTNFRSAGYQIFPYSFSDAQTSSRIEQGHDGMRYYPKDLWSDKGSDSIPPQHNAILFCGFPSGLNSFSSVFKEAREFLKERGLVLICHGMNDNPLMGKEPVPRYPGEVIASLYESGFSILCNEWILEGVRTRGDQEKQSRKSWHFVVGKKNGAFVRGYQEGDETDILTMFKEVFNVNRNLEHWYWKFRDNPFGAYRIAEAFAEDGTLAGHYSGYPVPFHTSTGKEFLSYQIGDIMTRPGFRQVGLATTSVLGRIADYFHHRFCLGTVPFMYGFVAGNHKRFGERFLRYRYLHEIPYHVLNPSELRLSAKEKMSLLLAGCSVKEVTETTREFDVFFHEASEGYGILVKRDASYLKWRYLDCPESLHTLVAVRCFGKLVGWSVFSKRRDTLIWGDALFRKTISVRTVKRMLAYVLRYYFPGVARIEGWFSPEPHWWTNLLREIGFRLTDEPNRLVSGVTIFDRSFSLECIKKDFYYAMGDSDLF
jgi:hypothetical protein